RADSTKDGTDGQTGIFAATNAKKVYIWDPNEVYPSECSTASYNLTLADELGIEETITTPVIADWTNACQNAVMTNISTDASKVEYELYI